MAETAALLADEVLPERPLRPWVLSLPIALRFLLATNPAVLSQVLGVASPGTAELQALVQNITERIGRLLEQRGLIERDCENAWLSGDMAQAGSLDDLIGHSITYRMAVGPRADQKVFTLQTVPAQGEEEGRNGAAQASGFSLHAALVIQPGQRAKLEPLDFMARLAALVPPPRMPHGRMKVIASIKDAVVIARILSASGSLLWHTAGTGAACRPDTATADRAAVTPQRKRASAIRWRGGPAAQSRQRGGPRCTR
jgi:hypothetical protein